MNKENIVKIAKDFLDKTSSDGLIIELSKSHKKFFNNLSKLNVVQIDKILDVSPEFSNKTYDGWHAMHYACLTNDSYIVDVFMKRAMRNGLSSLPLTEKSKKDITQNVSLLNFCSANNCDSSFAKILTYLSNPEEQDFCHSLIFSISYYSSKTANLLKNFISEEDFQKTSFEFLLRDNGAVFFRVLNSGFKFNINRFADFGINLKQTYENENNYFSVFLNSLCEKSYILDDLFEKDNKFSDKILNCINFFLDNGYSLDAKNINGIAPKEQLTNLIYCLSYELQDVLNKFLESKETIAKSLNNDLAKKNIPECKKIKI